MAIKEDILNEQVFNALCALLGSVPFLKVRKLRQGLPKNGTIQPDITVGVGIGNRKDKLLVVECKTNGQPRLARDAINQLCRFRESYPKAYGIIAAPYISPAAAGLCEKEGIGYIDLAGNCRLVFDKVYVVKEGGKNPFTVKRDLRSLYSPRAARVVRVLLDGPAKPWKIQPLAREAGVSVGQTANVKKLLKDREWIKETGQGLVMISPVELINEWTRNYTLQKNQVQGFYSMANIPSIETALAEACSRQGIPFALTGLSGAARVRPGVRYSRITAYCGRTDPEVMESAGLKEVDSGANVNLLTPYDAGVFYGSKVYEGIPTVSPVQLYLDLANNKGRGQEAAKTIYEKDILPLWQ